MASQSSFASPLYWHIRTLSSALDASNAAETVDELEHVSQAVRGRSMAILLQIPGALYSQR